MEALCMSELLVTTHQHKRLTATGVQLASHHVHAKRDLGPRLSTATTALPPDIY